MRPSRVLPLAALLLSVLVVPASPATAAAHTDVTSVERTSTALVAPTAGTVEAYVRSPGGALVRQGRDDAGRWSTGQSLGGQLTSQPSAVSMTAGRTDVFARGARGQLVQRFAVEGRWSAWIDLGGSFTGAPAVASWGPGRLDVFARGNDGALVHRWHAVGRWSAWERLGGALASSPAAVATGVGQLEVLVRGTDAKLHQVSYVGAGQWSRWRSLGGVLTSQPAAVTTGQGRLDVLVRGGDGALHVRSYAPATGWTAFSRLVGPVSSGPGVVLVPGSGLLVAARDSAGRVVLRSRSSNGVWSGWWALDALRSLRGLGAWVDVFDYELAGAPLRMDAALDDLDARGVRTLYLQTARFSSTFDVARAAGRWVDAAHARGMAVVGWYLPGYGDMARDLRRTMAIATLVTPAGGRFDAVGVDVEAHSGWGTGNEVPRTTMNARAVEHLRAVRARTSVPLVAITPQPVATDGAGETWEGFPWAAVGAAVDAVLPMAYQPRTCHDACVRDYMATNARYAASWSGRPVHLAGRGYPSGDGTQVTDSDVRHLVDGALSARVLGGSVYDYASTRSRTAWWPALQRFNAA